MKKSSFLLLLILLIYTVTIRAQIESPAPDKKTVMTTAGNYNDYIIEHWKKAAGKFHKAAAMLNESANWNKAFLNELKKISKDIDESVVALDKLEIYKDNDMDFVLCTFKVLDFYQRYTDIEYPKIIKKLGSSTPDFDALQQELDELSELELVLTETFLEAQAAFAEYYHLEIK